MPSETSPQYGPLTILTVKSASNRFETRRDIVCDGCTYLRSKWYSAQGDSGFDFRCAATGEGRPQPYLVSARHQTPQTCPYLSGVLTGPVEVVGWTP